MADAAALGLLAPGDRIGRFAVERVIGGGGTGTVYLAQDTLLGVRVALKVLKPGARDIVTERFKRELLLARRILHPGVCRVFDIHEEGECLFLTMEYIEGESLEALLSRRPSGGPLELGFSVALLRSVCEAVAAAHAVGVLHRDLKPSNILVGPGQTPSVVDFGCATARSLGRLTKAGFVVGTIRYLAPEILQGADASEQSDLYALGMVLYRCVSGRHPYEIQSIDEALQKAMAGAGPPSRFNPAIDQHLDGVVLRALAPAPAARYKDLRDLAAALAQVGETTAPEEVRRPTPAKAPPQRPASPPAAAAARPPAPVPMSLEATPAPPPDPDHARCLELVRWIKAETGRKGLIEGDDPAADQLLLTAQRQLEQARYKQAVRFYDMARRRIEATAVDRTFIASKLARLRTGLDSAAGPVAAGGSLEDIQQLLASRLFDAANSALNELFASIRRA